MLNKILFIGLDKSGKDIIHYLKSLIKNTPHQLMTLTTKNSLDDDYDIENIILPGENLSLELICQQYQLIQKKINSKESFVIFIGQFSQICLPLIHLVKKTKLSYLFCLESNQKNLPINDNSILNLQTSQYEFKNKIIDLTSLLFCKKNSINWIHIQSLTTTKFYYEIMPINITDINNINHQIDKITTVLETSQAKNNYFLLINNNIPLIEDKITTKLNKLDNCTLIICQNPTLNKSKLSLISTKNINSNEIQLDFNFKLKNNQLINEKIDQNNLNIPTFRRKGVTIDQGF